jgi:7-cyano-7-deazaguanine tRNA-ribosyltransferase
MDFEVLKTDLLGRIGKLTVNGKSIETPYLFPVVHPIKQELSIARISKMGFPAIMTNAYIAYRRAKEVAIEKGIHGLLGFEGIVMTDSGGYQVLEYGDVNVSYRQIAEFQLKIGSDLAVTLDEPTGDTRSKAFARRTMKKSLDSAIKTIKQFSAGKTEWVGPVQGGLFPDLLRISAKSLLKEGFRLLALGSPVQIMENYRFSELVNMIKEVRNVMPYSVPLHLFGAGHPLTIALAVALGCDMFDSASYILFAKQSRYMTESTVLSVEDIEYFPCSCEVCIKTTPSELRDMEESERIVHLSEHNLYMLKNEIMRTKQAICEGRLWDLIHERAAAHPSLTDAFTSLAAMSEGFVDSTPVVKKKGIFVRSVLDFVRPELLSSKRMLERCFLVSKKDAIIFLQESKPLQNSVYSKLSSAADVYKIHLCLGIYPAELEFIYPFTQTVTSSNILDMELISKEAEKLIGLGYRNVYIVEKRGKRFVKKKFKSKQDLKVSSPSQAPLSHSQAPLRP